MLLGDRVRDALELAGIDEPMVSRIMGEDCCCEERRRKLNVLGRWAERIIRGNLHRAEEYLRKILE